MLFRKDSHTYSSYLPYVCALWNVYSCFKTLCKDSKTTYTHMSITDLLTSVVFVWLKLSFVLTSSKTFCDMHRNPWLSSKSLRNILSFLLSPFRVNCPHEHSQYRPLDQGRPGTRPCVCHAPLTEILNPCEVYIYVYFPSIISRHWDGRGCWGLSSWKTVTQLYIVFIMASDVPATEGARASTAVVIDYLGKGLITKAMWEPANISQCHSGVQYLSIQRGKYFP